MSAEEQSRFLQQLAEDLNSKNIQLPSFPDVVINIRTALEDPSCTSERLGAVVRTDPVLVARLLMSANSSFHNRAGIEIVDLNLAISRLGFEVVRNTAITLAVEQIFVASEHKTVQALIKQLWSGSLSLASMSFVIAARGAINLNPDNAFLCGLLHDIGKLYILTKARDFPNLLGDEESLKTVQDQWSASVGKSIIEAWGFPDDIADSAEINENLNSGSASLVDVVYLAKQLIKFEDEAINQSGFEAPAAKLNISADSLPGLREAYTLHAASMRQSAGS
ncbi:MAG: HDOD domain-containing protein [Pseudomonadota bacterium]